MVAKQSKQSRRWTRGDALALMEANPLQTPRFEVVRGELLMTPSPGGLHQVAVLELAVALRSYCEDTGIGEAFISPSDVDLERGGLVQPDVYVVPPEEGLRLRRKRTAKVLLLAVEILSPGSGYGDRGPKQRLYHAKVPGYWIVDPYRRQVEQWLAGRETATVEGERLTWHPAGTERPFVLELPAYFAKVHAE